MCRSCIKPVASICLSAGSAFMGISALSFLISLAGLLSMIYLLSVDIALNQSINQSHVQDGNQNGKDQHSLCAILHISGLTFKKKTKCLEK